METNKEILKVEIGSKRIVVHYSEVTNGIVDNYTVENSLKNKGIHPDLYKALATLDGYLAEIYYLAPSDKVVKVNSVELGGTVDKEYIVLGGQIAFASKNLGNIKSDKIRLEEEDCPYQFTEDLKLDVGVLMNEVKEYCFNNKQAQLPIPFVEEKEEQEPITNFQEATVVITDEVGFDEDDKDVPPMTEEIKKEIEGELF